MCGSFNLHKSRPSFPRVTRLSLSLAKLFYSHRLLIPMNIVFYFIKNKKKDTSITAPRPAQLRSPTKRFWQQAKKLPVFPSVAIRKYSRPNRGRVVVSVSIIIIIIIFVRYISCASSSRNRSQWRISCAINGPPGSSLPRFLAAGSMGVEDHRLLKLWSSSSPLKWSPRLDVQQADCSRTVDATSAAW